MKKRLIFQIIFCVLSALSVASVFFLGAFLGWIYALIGVAAAIIFGLLMLWIKRSTPKETDSMESEEENDESPEEK